MFVVGVAFRHVEGEMKIGVGTELHNVPGFPSRRKGEFIGSLEGLDKSR